MDFRIPLGHLYSTGVPFHMTDEAQAAESGMMDMLLNRDQVIADKQAGEMASLFAKANIEKIRPELQGLALRDIQANHEAIKGLYSSQRDRRSLTPENKIKASMLNTEHLGRIGALNQYTEDAKAAFTKMAELMKNPDNGITLDDFNRVKTKWENAVKTAGNIGDVPWLSALVAQEIDPKVKAATEKQKIQDLEAYNKLVIDAGEKRPAQVTNAETFDLMKATFPGATATKDYATLIRKSGFMENEPDDNSVLNEYAKSLTARIKPLYRQPANKTTINMPSWEKNWMPKYRIIDGEMTFNAKPTDGIIMTDNFVSDNSSLSAGDLFIPKKTYTKDGKRYVSGVTVVKGQFELSPNGIAMSNGATYNPVNVPIDDNMKAVIESNYFKPDKEGYPDQTPWGKLNAVKEQGKTQHPKGFVKEIKGDPDISKGELVLNGVYLINGQYRKWNGSKFQLIQ